MTLSLNEIKNRAVNFSKDWENETSEKGEAKTFWDDFFKVFGITRRRVATFEKNIKTLGNKQGYIDLFWKGNLVVEHKSKGANLDKAYSQAIDYFSGLKEYELPKYVIVSDFQKFRLYDLEEDKLYEFDLIDLHKNIYLFGFLTGYKKKTYKEEDPVNIKAALLMGQLHDELYEFGYKGHKLEIFLVRLLFCMFADDTGIFEKSIFFDYLQQKTNEDGSDLGLHLAKIFEVLNKSPEERQINLDESLKQFVYVDGKLFEEYIEIPDFGKDMRDVLLKCCSFNWSLISPAIFGSLFQSVMDKEKRRNLGAHYTEEKNIMKLIRSLFLDDLYKELKLIGNNKKKLIDFHKKISNIKILDPTCGCGNFLIISYRELRLLEIEILKKIIKDDVYDIDIWLDLNVDSMFGIELEEFPAKIAEVAMWLIDHQMNMKASEEFGIYYIRLPLKKSANIINGNALKIIWEKLLPAGKFDYIIGNPPYVGKAFRNDGQNEDMNFIFKKVKGYGVLDYVSCWYLKAAEYIKDSNTKVAFVSTNSITQGEQVGILWNELLNNYKVKIHFAHRTFSWSSEARGKAQVFVVIIGFTNFDIKDKYIFDYANPKSEAQQLKVNNINPYLVEGKDMVILKRKKPICDVPEIVFGSMPNDGGNLLLSKEEKEHFLISDPETNKFIKPLVSAKEFLNDTERYCLWLTEIQPSELKKFPEIEERVKKVKEYRIKSNRETTRELASYPTLFGEIRQPQTDYIVIPRVSSENRTYIPIGFFTKNEIASDSCLTIPGANLYHFGILTSIMHMTWVKYMCGRLKSDFRYSNELVYNNFPWPLNPSNKDKLKIIEKAQKILKTREVYKNSSLSDLYNPLRIPPLLTKAHKELDDSVDLCYRKQKFNNDKSRMEFLLDLFQIYTKALF
ncbi:MAG: class I SAM-dependent DNA methyltransferase [Actinobacteria bacterium]|nr:class I SAM-dependent DNA methyltransferase [Actinomycetota bacterium]